MAIEIISVRKAKRLDAYLKTPSMIYRGVTTLNRVVRTNWHRGRHPSRGAPLPVRSIGAPVMPVWAPVRPIGAPQCKRGVPACERGATACGKGAPVKPIGAPLAAIGAPCMRNRAHMLIGAPPCENGAPWKRESRLSNVSQGWCAVCSK